VGALHVGHSRLLFRGIRFLWRFDVKKKIVALALALGMLAAPMAALAHTGTAHLHLTSHGIVGDGGGWYHKSVVGGCAGGQVPVVHKHYTYLASKRMYVYKHSTVTTKNC
jgi:hypothetical protein